MVGRFVCSRKNHQQKPGYEYEGTATVHYLGKYSWNDGNLARRWFYLIAILILVQMDCISLVTKIGNLMHNFFN
jgi:hypothetical protein